MFTDSKSLFDSITKLSTVSEKRLLIKIAAIQESLRNGDLSDVRHVSSRHNIANVFTKSKTQQTMLRSAMTTGKHIHPISQWILPSE